MNKRHLKLYKNIANLIMDCSADKKKKVGAILIKDGRILATGYNGQIPGEKHIPIERNGKDISTVHAEQNVLCFCAKNGISTNDCELITTLYPCNDCTKLLIQAGIKRIYYIEEKNIGDNIFKKFIKIKKLK